MVHQTTKVYYLPLLIGTIISIGSLATILVYINPYQVGVITHAFFYLTLFLSVSGIFTISGLLFRSKFFPGIYADLFSTSLRQGLLMGALLTGLILLEAINVYKWWIGLLFILLLLMIEFFFMTPNKK